MGCSSQKRLQQLEALNIGSRDAKLDIYIGSRAAVIMRLIRKWERLSSFDSPPYLPPGLAVKLESEIDV